MCVVRQTFSIVLCSLFMWKSFGINVCGLFLTFSVKGRSPKWLKQLFPSVLASLRVSAQNCTQVVFVLPQFSSFEKNWKKKFFLKTILSQTLLERNFLHFSRLKSTAQLCNTLIVLVFTICHSWVAFQKLFKKFSNVQPLLPLCFTGNACFKSEENCPVPILGACYKPFVIFPLQKSR